MTNDTAISAIAATLPTTGAAIHALEDVEPPVSWPAVSGTAFPEEAEDGAGAMMLVVGKKKGGSGALATREEDDVAMRSVVADAGAGSEGSGAGAEVDPAGGVAGRVGAVAVLPPGGVKNTAPPAPGVGEGRDIVDTAGSVAGGPGAGSTTGLAGADAAGGGPAATIAESVRRSAAMALEFVTAVLR
jgi:hypothetical protein